MTPADVAVVCGQCGTRTLEPSGICAWHFHGREGANGFDAKANKIWNDYFHRGVEIQRCPEDDPDPVDPTAYGSDIAYDIC